VLLKEWRNVWDRKAKAKDLCTWDWDFPLTLGDNRMGEKGIGEITLTEEDIKIDRSGGRQMSIDEHFEQRRAARSMATKLKEHVIRGGEENEPVKFFYVCEHLPRRPGEKVYQEFQIVDGLPFETRMCDACYRSRYTGCCGS
jgi:hypothetical protein